MFDTVDVKTLGTIFTAVTVDGTSIKEIQVISANEITDAALGEFNETFSTYSEYLAQTIECLHGFNTDPGRILWWNCENASDYEHSTFVPHLNPAFTYALNNGYDVIILEDPIPKED